MKEDILKLIAEHFNKEVDELDENMSFQDDLNADSIELVELIMSIEEEYDIEVAEEDLEKLETIGDVIDYLEEIEQWSNMKEELNLFQEKIGYFFNDISLLKTALTHSSYVNENRMHHYESNERLEFLGDAVLDLVIGEFIYLKYPKESEGYLSKLRSECVNEHILFTISKQIGIGSLIYFGRGEIKNGGRFRESTSADAIEALIGAIYLDSSFETCEEFVLKLFDSYINVSDIKNISRDYKTEFQEMIQKSGKTCKYEIIREEGPDNDKTFYCQLVLDGEVVGKGQGKTKKKATQMAAKTAVNALEESKNV